MAKMQIFLTCVIIYWFSCGTALAEQTSNESSACSPTVEKLRCLYEVDEETAANITYLSDSVNECGLTSTCCAPLAEYYLKNDVTLSYQTRLTQLLSTTISPCLAKDLINSTVEFIEATKESFFQGLDILFQPVGGLSNTERGYFIRLFDYLKQGVPVLDYCQLAIEFERLYFSIYSAAFTTLLKRENLAFPPGLFPNSSTCFYNYFRSQQGDLVTREYVRFSQRYSLLFRYLRGLATSNKILEKVLGHVLSPDCQLNLFQLTHCSACSPDIDGSVLPCPAHCTNVIRGCLTDIKELSTSYNEFYQSMKKTRMALSDYNPYDVFTVFQSSFFGLINEIINNFDTIKSDVQSQCSIQFTSSSKRKRSLVALSHQINKRQSTAVPNAILEETATCIKDVSELLSQLDTLMCSGNVANDNCNCWNGTSVGSYMYASPEGDRISQRTNPELTIEPTTGLKYLDEIAQLKNVTGSLNSCTNQISSCPVVLCNITLPTSTNITLSSNYDTFNTIDIPIPALTNTTSCNITSSVQMTEMSSCPQNPLPTIRPTSTTVVATSTTSVVRISNTPVETVGTPNGTSSQCAMFTLSLLLFLIVHIIV